MQLFNRTDEKGRMILELAVEENHLDVVKLILAKNPVYGRRIWRMYPELMGIMPLIYRAMDNEKHDIVNLLTQTYQRGVQMMQVQKVVQTRESANVHQFISANVHQFISDMDRGNEGMYNAINFNIT